MKNKKVNNNMKLLITIILYILLAFAFVVQFDISNQEIGDNVSLPFHIGLVFIFGILSVVFAFLTYISPRKGIDILAYMVAIVFLFILFSYLLNEMAPDILEGPYNSPTFVIISFIKNMLFNGDNNPRVIICSGIIIATLVGCSIIAMRIWRIFKSDISS